MTPVGVPWLGMKIADVSTLNSVLLVGSFLRKDQPLLSARLRAATKRGCKVSVLHAVDSDLLMPVANKTSCGRPSGRKLERNRCGDCRRAWVPAPIDGVSAGEKAKAIATSLMSGERKAIFLGNAAIQHPQAAQLRAWAQWIAKATGATSVC